MSRARALSFVLHLLFFLSGAAALGYQFAWAKMFSTGLGHETPAVLAIVGAFMIGMALGAATLDRLIPRTPRAGRWLAGLEITIGIWALLVSLFTPQINQASVQLIGLAPSALKHWSIALIIPALTLLPATMAMGATFPAMEKFLSTTAPRNESIGSVYAANTFGAVAGTLITPYFLLPALGLSKSCWFLAAINVLVGVTAWALSRAPQVVAEPVLAPSPPRAPISLPRLRCTLFATGLLGLGYEVAGIRVLSQVLKNTMFTYAAVLAVFLLATASGAFVYHRWWRHKEPRQLLATLLCGTALACFVGILLMTRTPALYLAARQIGDSRVAVLIAELLAAAVVFAGPAFCMGATFSHLAQLARAACGRVGAAVAMNTLGAALAPAIFGVAFIPSVGTQWTLLLVGFGYALLVPARPSLFVAIPGVVACVSAMVIHFSFITVPRDGYVIDHREGVMASVAVIDEGQNRSLRVDNSFQMGGTGSSDAEYRHAHLPLLLHSAPRRALFLGLGTGITFGAASTHPNLNADGVELLPEVMHALPFFEPQNFAPAQQPHLKLHIADARRFVQTIPENYDVIVADLFHPYRDGAGALYTREHFSAIRRRLAPEGIFCQWLPLFQLDAPTLRVIVRTFRSEFPHGEAWLLRFNVDVPVMALIGGASEQRWLTNQVEARLNDARLATELKRLALADSLRVYGHLLAEAADLDTFAGEAPLNTDDNQRVTFMASRLPYQDEARRYESLLALLAVAKLQHATARHISPADAEFASQLSRYWAARNVYLHGLVHDAESRRDQAVDAYIESARLSSDFTAGYAQCLTIASVVAASDPARSREILEKLVAAQPKRPVARQMLDRLFPK